MATCPTDSAVYQEEIKTIVFRQDDGIVIPKLVREQAYELAIDVIIRSIPRETYKNYTCSPAESFYGNATLVFQDAIHDKIPLKFPRQRIYYGRVPEAFEQWNALINFEYMRAYFLAVGESLQSLGTALGAGSIPAIFCCSLPEPRWRELPIREAYVNVPDGTQYEIEITWLTPIPFSDSCDTFYEGLSGQDDGDKDDGLPSEGIFPNVADDPSNPFDRLPPATPDSEQGGFSSSKIANLDDEDSDNEPDPVGTIYWIEVIAAVTRNGDFGAGCRTRTSYLYFRLIDNSVTWTTETVNSGVTNPCGGTFQSVKVFLSGGTGALTQPNDDNGNLVITKQSGLVLPTNRNEFS
jgi:hypothetical protein